MLGHAGGSVVDTFQTVLEGVSECFGPTCFEFGKQRIMGNLNFLPDLLNLSLTLIRLKSQCRVFAVIEVQTGPVVPEPEIQML